MIDTKKLLVKSMIHVSVTWIIFFLALVIICLIDRHVRLSHGGIQEAGIASRIWYGMHTLAGCLAMLYFYSRIHTLYSITGRIAWIVVTLVGGVIIYILTLLWYVLGSGIDSL